MMNFLSENIPFLQDVILNSIVVAMFCVAILFVLRRKNLALLACIVILLLWWLHEILIALGRMTFVSANISIYMAISALSVFGGICLGRTRLARERKLLFREHIPLTVGVICGGIVYIVLLFQFPFHYPRNLFFMCTIIMACVGFRIELLYRNLKKTWGHKASKKRKAEECK